MKEIFNLISVRVSPDKTESINYLFYSICSVIRQLFFNYNLRQNADVDPRNINVVKFQNRKTEHFYSAD